MSKIGIIFKTRYSVKICDMKYSGNTLKYAKQKVDYENKYGIFMLFIPCIFLSLIH
jgi:hypothetical protein